MLNDTSHHYLKEFNYQVVHFSSGSYMYASLLHYGF